MEFTKFRNAMQSHMKKMLDGQNVLFVTDIDKDKLWNMYLDSFPAGINEVFRARREYDCSCCRSFIKAFGNVVAIKDNKVISIWDFIVGDNKYQPVIDALSAYIHSVPISGVFITKESKFGTVKNHEQLEDGTVRTWDHLYIELPKKFVLKSNETVGTVAGELNSTKAVFQRSLEEISKDSLESVLDIIGQNSLYKGEEWKAVLEKFLTLHNEYKGLKPSLKENFCWKKSQEVGGVIGKIRNHSIGVLLTDITNGIDIDEAVRRYERIVAPTNYKRPKAIFTEKMINQAEQTITELGYTNSTGRKFAIADDVAINNVLFSDKDVIKLSNSVFDELRQESVVSPKAFGKIEEISIDRFITDVLPRTSKIEVLFENRHLPNLVSLIAPKNPDSPTMFKWNNGFSWAYNGNISDSMKQRVKNAGGNVDGVLRFSLQWNENLDNDNDFDAHCIEPNGNRIYFGNKKVKHRSSGVLDVDIMTPNGKIAVENITWTDKNRMGEGKYEFYVHNYSHRGGRSGFSAEIEYEGQIYSYSYNKELRHREFVPVAFIDFNKETGIKFIKTLDNSVSSRQEWGINTNNFHVVSVCMYSPNYWDLQTRIGNKHYFFMIKDCVNSTRPNGFFNEFLKEELLEHKRVFEALGGKMKVENSQDQLSGLGFSSTQRNSIICRVSGHITRTIKITF